MTLFKTLDDAAIEGKRVLVRVDLNVPMKDGVVTDTTRIERILPTIREIVEKGGRAILLAHFGRPKGKADPSQSLAPIAPVLAEKLGQPVGFAEDCVGPVADGIVANMKNGDVLLLENTRFHAGEEKERRDLRLAARGARRRLCQRRLLGRPPRPCLDGRARASSPLLCRPHHAGRA